jgi:hypothetical protein
LEFNLSHSGDFALIAVTQGRRIGVDVERIRQGISSHVIAQQYFSKAEVAELQSLPIEQREPPFSHVGRAKKRISRRKDWGCLYRWKVLMFPLRPVNLPFSEQLVQTRKGSRSLDVAFIGC